MSGDLRIVVKGRRWRRTVHDGQTRIPRTTVVQWVVRRLSGDLAFYQ
jgi:hypothetical protein